MKKVNSLEGVKPGRYFKAVIGSIPVTGRIQIEGSHYLCHDNSSGDVQGGEPNDKLGFKSSWQVGDGSEKSLDYENVAKLYLLTRDEYRKIPKPAKPILVGQEAYIVEFKKGKIEVGCQTISNKVVRLIASKLID